MRPGVRGGSGSTRRAAVVSDLIAVVALSALYTQWGTASMDVVLAIGAVVLGLTACAFGLARAWDPMVFGHGSAEFTRLMRGFPSAAVAAVVSLASQLPEGRLRVFGVLPIAGALAAKRPARRWWKELHRRRRGGGHGAGATVGTEDAVAALVAQTQRAPHEGWMVVAACTPAGCARTVVTSSPACQLWGISTVASLARTLQFDTISVTRSSA